MKIVLRAYDMTQRHIYFSVRVNGDNSGNLCMTKATARTFRDLVQKGCADTKSDFDAPGCWEKKRKWSKEGTENMSVDLVDCMKWTKETKCPDCGITLESRPAKYGTHAMIRCDCGCFVQTSLVSENPNPPQKQKG
jgi:hypothetical protein